jgi:hypothetical protein
MSNRQYLRNVLVVPSIGNTPKVTSSCNDPGKVLATSALSPQKTSQFEVFLKSLIKFS